MCHARRGRFAVVVVTAVSMILMTGCGGPSRRDGGGAGRATGTGPITLVQGKDASQKLQPSILDKWNAAHPDEKVTLVELPESAEDQHSAFVQSFQARSDLVDLVALDVVWMAEFAARGWVARIDKGDLPLDRVIPAVLDTATYNGELYAAPVSSSGGLLYYRADLVPSPPSTWEELIGHCASVAKPRKMDCYAGQFFKDEGLTVNASEVINSAGGSILTDEGRAVAVNSPEARKGLEFLVNGFQDGYIPPAAIRYKEEEGQTALRQGKLLFLRGWPGLPAGAPAPGSSSAVRGNSVVGDRVVQDRVGIAPLPGLKGPGVSTLGGYNYAVSSFSKKKRSATQFLKFVMSEQIQKTYLTDLSTPPVIAALYDDPKLVERFPYLPALKQSIMKARARPKTPNYHEVTAAIREEAHAALQGRKSVDQALADLEATLEATLKEVSRGGP